MGENAVHAKYIELVRIHNLDEFSPEIPMLALIFLI